MHFKSHYNNIIHESFEFEFIDDVEYQMSLIFKNIHPSHIYKCKKDFTYWLKDVAGLDYKKHYKIIILIAEFYDRVNIVIKFKNQEDYTMLKLQYG